MQRTINMKKYWNIYIGLTILILGLFFSSCYTRIEGCLDPESTNYSIEGDDPCIDCCILPTVKISVFHQNGDTTFFLEDTLVNNLGQQYSIVKFAYLLSDFNIKSVNDQSYQVVDFVSLNVGAVEALVKDDVIRVRRDGFSFDLGTIIFNDPGQSVSFKMGLPEVMNDNRFTVQVEGHPLTTDPDSLFNAESGDYVFQRIKVASGIDFRDTMVYDVTGLENVQEVVVVVDIPTTRGKNKTIIIEARYNIWFEDVDFATMNIAQIESQIVLKSRQMFFAR